MSGKTLFPYVPHICNIFDTIAMFHLDHKNIAGFQNLDLQESGRNTLSMFI